MRTLIMILAALSLAACNKPEFNEVPATTSDIDKNIKVVRYCSNTSIFEINGETVMLNSNKTYTEITPEALADLCA